MKNKLRKPFPFGDYLKKLRARKGVSLKKVEKATGISRQCARPDRISVSDSAGFPRCRL